MSNDVHPPWHEVRAAVGRALAEDLTPLGDLTSGLLPEGLAATAFFVPRSGGVLAGIRCAEEAFAQIDPGLTVEWSADDGEHLTARECFGRVTGALAAILTAERTALNFLGHLSGVATLTARFVEAARPLRVWDTRKTTPGLRALEKAAVRAGGGVNHRGNLSDWVLLKDNHLALVCVAEAVEQARERWPGRTVHVECETLDDVKQAVTAGADALLLDNMAPSDVALCFAVAGEASRPPLVEISGGITLESVASYAATCADLVSVGAITHSAPLLDICLDIAGDIAGDIAADGVPV
ncbi:carboxylating nicotinate-nucleotide diphosphorylase [soil metagenome]